MIFHPDLINGKTGIKSAFTETPVETCFTHIPCDSCKPKNKATHFCTIANSENSTIITALCAVCQRLEKAKILHNIRQ